MTAERRVWIAQCLCPVRHAVFATAGEADSRAEAEEKVEAGLRNNVAALLQSGEVNRWCGLCHAPAASWHYELARTRFRSMAEARPKLKETELQNRLAAALWGGMKRSD
jgi:hypothetical protein